VAQQRVERKLAAILAADVAGYSRLVGTDEEGTIARLSSHRSILIDPKIEQHHEAQGRRSLGAYRQDDQRLAPVARCVHGFVKWNGTPVAGGELTPRSI
jgi:class 3 adenylate cyclase